MKGTALNRPTLRVALALSLSACAHHPADCAIGVPWSDCLAGTAGYNNGGGSDTRETELKIKAAEDKAKAAEEKSKGKDLYTELAKLDDLRKRGIITQDEYNEQKRRLLEKQ